MHDHALVLRNLEAEKVMGRTFRLLNLNCRNATRLVSDQQERPLDALERTGLAIHLMGCGNCRRYRDQIQMLDELCKAASDVPNDTNHLTSAARQRIHDRLRDERGGLDASSVSGIL
jgi:hypothetical protein